MFGWYETVSLPCNCRGNGFCGEPSAFYTDTDQMCPVQTAILRFGLTPQKAQELWEKADLPFADQSVDFKLMLMGLSQVDPRTQDRTMEIVEALREQFGSQFIVAMRTISILTLALTLGAE